MPDIERYVCYRAWLLAKAKEEFSDMVFVLSLLKAQDSP